MGRILDSPQVAAWLLERLGAQGTVAIVGNSPDALMHEHGELIDRHALVVRLNAGVPGPEHALALGTRTDVLGVGNLAVLQEAEKFAGLEMVWFTKPSTRLGDSQWGILSSVARVADKDLPVYRIPPHLYDPLAEEVGAPPSGGLFLVNECLRLGLRGRLHLFGFSFFGAAGSPDSWWHKERPEAKLRIGHPHNGRKELEWFKRQGLTDQKPGVYGL